MHSWRWAALLVLSLLVGLFAVVSQKRQPKQHNPDLEHLIRSLGDEYLICADGTSQPSGSRWTQYLGIWRHMRPLLSQKPKASHIYTLATSQPESPGEVECLFVKSGRVLSSGTRLALGPLCDSFQGCMTHEVPYGHTLLPAFTDAHGHLLDLGQSLLSVDLTGAESLSECRERLESFLASHPDLDKSAWIEGGGWDHTRWIDWPNKARFPTAQDMIENSVSLRERKISLKRIDFHALWLSPAALQTVMADDKIPPGVEVIPGGSIVLDSEGRPSGVLVDHAMRFALEVIPRWTNEDRKKFLKQAVDLLLSEGITGVGDAAASIDDIVFYADTIRAGTDLGVRTYAFLSCESSQIVDDAECFEALVSRLAASGSGPLLLNEDAASDFTLRTVKLFADGALGSWGAALFLPYSDRPTERGSLTMNESAIPAIVNYWADKGYQIATHAIGDRANALVLDAYEEVLLRLTSQGEHDLRARIEHAQILRSQDFARFKSPTSQLMRTQGPLSIIASMQPSQYASDEHYLPSRLGPDRLANAFPWRSLLGSGSHVLFGSDFPVESPSVLAGIRAATTRTSPTADVVPETLTRLEALRAYTSAPPFGQFQEKVLGSLESEKWADWILTFGDILDDRQDLQDIRVVATVKRGKPAWLEGKGRLSSV
ncbi:hypothetical protein BCV69DRAFT_285324 [Microstroma glucosiphilum]|uniref:Amidohydrolase 3 domain-containing protein n=1 Tax=Pseudomicrostroma glucosiphilum TaxID=1684307 RepID=A0A316TYL0_9BASI|nr:hypothetical protein BCV69DRAFT_285324 [Pseudomicrostroma glucosiphilum]PWN18356.1 hypothetical protein BCV69DRAFT_285324 [Pseudomicrostroma glucosiphilum]